ncbi:DNA-binding response regulator [Sphingomonas sp. GCM10030256]|uniref:response regulator transcription factor n=1 Tax=Sphingomonas sp. GCM10030256 TaxID=3273427 RepID=UPI003609A462
MDQHGRLLIAHQDALARNYLRSVATRELQLLPCAEAGSFDSLLEELHKGHPVTLALVDLELPGMSQSLGLRYLTAHHPILRIAVLFTSLGTTDLEQLAASGVAALVPKQTPEASLIDILGRFVAGLNYVPFAAAQDDGSAGDTQNQLSFLDYELTSRQSEVLRLLSRGHSNRTIARMLGIAEGTVKVHVNAAFRVLGVHNRVSAAAALRTHFAQSDSQVP